MLETPVTQRRAARFVGSVLVMGLALGGSAAAGPGGEQGPGKPHPKSTPTPTQSPEPTQSPTPPPTFDPVPCAQKAVYGALPFGSGVIVGADDALTCLEYEVREQL